MKNSRTLAIAIIGIFIFSACTEEAVENQLQDETNLSQASSTQCIAGFSASPVNGSKVIGGVKVKISAFLLGGCGDITNDVTLYKGYNVVQSNALNFTGATGETFVEYSVPTNLVVGNDYNFRILNYDGVPWGFNENTPFSIVSNRNDWVTTNYSGSQYTIELGENLHISWNQGYEDFDKNVKLDLYNSSNQFVTNIVASTPNNSYYDYIIPFSITAGQYKIRISTVGNSGRFDYSANFTVSVPEVIVDWNFSNSTGWSHGGNSRFAWCDKTSISNGRFYTGNLSAVCGDALLTSPNFYWDHSISANYTLSYYCSGWSNAIDAKLYKANNLIETIPMTDGIGTYIFSNISSSGTYHLKFSFDGSVIADTPEEGDGIVLDDIKIVKGL